MSFCTRSEVSGGQIKLFESTNHTHLEIEKEKKSIVKLLFFVLES